MTSWEPAGRPEKNNFQLHFLVSGLIKRYVDGVLSAAQERVGSEAFSPPGILSAASFQTVNLYIRAARRFPGRRK